MVIVLVTSGQAFAHLKTRKWSSNELLWLDLRIWIQDTGSSDALQDDMSCSWVYYLLLLPPIQMAPSGQLERTHTGI